MKKKSILHTAFFEFREYVKIIMKFYNFNENVIWQISTENTTAVVTIPYQYAVQSLLNIYTTE